jgi:hypothetical protein
MEVCKMPSSYKTVQQPTKQTLLRMFSSIGGGKRYNTFPVLLTLYSLLTLYATTKQKTTIQNVWFAGPLPVALVHAPLFDGNIYKCMLHALKHALKLHFLCCYFFWPKKVAMT